MIPNHLSSTEDFYLSHPELDPDEQEKKKKKDSFLAELNKLKPTSRTPETEKLLWPLESLTKKEVEEQLSQERTAGQAIGYYEMLSSGKLGYQEKGVEYPFPNDQEIFNYLQEDPKFVEFLQTKEKQLENLSVQVSPIFISLERMIKIVDKKVVELGGAIVSQSDSWKTDLDQLKYFTRLDKNNNITGGATKAEILANPQKYPFIVNGYIISVIENKDDLPTKNDQVTPIAGRTPLKGGEKGFDYLKKFFDPNSPYYGEFPSITPEEWLTLFSQKLQQKYIKTHKNIELSNSDIFDTKSATYFVVCQFSSGGLPLALWDPGVHRFRLGDSVPGGSFGGLLPRPALRKKLKI